MSRLPFMPMYWSDYLGDTGNLTTEQHGAYLLLIGHYWQQGKLPTNDAELAQICRASAYKWAKLKPTIAAFFSPDWKHKKIERLLSQCAEKRAKCKISGSKGGLRTQKLFRDLGGIPQGIQSLAQAGAQAIAKANAPAIALASLKRETESSLSAPLEPEPRERIAEPKLQPGEPDPQPADDSARKWPLEELLAAQERRKQKRLAEKAKPLPPSTSDNSEPGDEIVEPRINGAIQL